MLAAVSAAPAWAGTADARAALGRTATPAEVAAWDIDVRPDFQGLPRGSGTVAQGQKVWDGKCASCHGDFGESNEVFTPLVGGTSAEDIKRGRVAGMTGNQPYRTTLMKVSTVSTLWDYIHRAMPWNAPKSLSVNDVYAVTAYMLHLGEIVPADFTLSEANIAEVQRRMPNRDGMTTGHGLWPGRGRPDTRNTACMKDCAGKVVIASSIPDYARDAHGELGQQQRTFGPVRGVAAGNAASKVLHQRLLGRPRQARGSPASTSAWPATRWTASWWGRPLPTSPASTRARTRMRRWRARSRRAGRAHGAACRCRRSRRSRIRTCRPWWAGFLRQNSGLATAVPPGGGQCVPRGSCSCAQRPLPSPRLYRVWRA